MGTKPPLDGASAAILERISKEATRDVATTRSHLIGGVAELGATLDAFLRELLVEVERGAGRKPSEFLAIGTKKVSLRKATAGQLLHAAVDAAAGQTLSSQVRACIEDARTRNSVFSAVLKLRNDAVHQTVLAADANVTLARLATLLEVYREEAGWDR